MSAGLLDMALTVRTWTSFGAPELIALKSTVWIPAFSLVTTLLIGAKVGGSFTGVTVTLKLRTMRLFRLWPSSTVTVMMAIPLALAKGAKLSVPAAFGLV